MSAPTQQAAPPGARRLAGLDWRWVAVGGGLVAAGLALGTYQRRVIGLQFDIVPDVARIALAMVGLWLACGYAAARTLAPAALRPHAPVLALPLGAVISALALAALGLAHVPFDVSLALVVAAGVVSAVLVRRARGPLRAELPERRGPPGADNLWPLYIGLIVAAIALSPVWRLGQLTVMGRNGDAVLVVGSAELLQRAPPTSIRPELPVDRVPLVWRSKYPIFYSLAAVARLSDRSPIAAFQVVLAGVLAMAAFGFFLLARHPLGAGPVTALLAMGLAGMDRMSLHLAFGPFYNQAWALLALPFVLVAGWSFLREPTRGALALLVLFGALGAFAYPLMLPFPVLFLVVAAILQWRRARAAGTRPAWARALRPARLPVWAAIPAAIVLLALAAVLVRGVGEKLISAASALSPWGSLDAWTGTALPFLPFHWFFGLVDPGGVVLVALLLAVVLAAAAHGLWRAPPDAAIPLAVTLGAGLLAGVYFRHRAQAELFYLREMTLLGPLVLTAAAVGIGDLAGRARERGRGALGVAAGVAAVAAAALLLGLSGVGDRRIADETGEHATRGVLELRTWGDRLPAGSSIRIDVPPSGWQLWADYMLSEHPVSAREPLVGFFPYPPQGRKADYVLAMAFQPTPADAVGTPVFESLEFRLWRMDPAVPGPDVSSRRMVDSVTKVDVGL